MRAAEAQSKQRMRANTAGKTEVAPAECIRRAPRAGRIARVPPMFALRNPFARPPVWFLVLALLVGASLLRNWNASILDRHEFRQTQTALSAHWLREEGGSLAYPLPVFGPPWSAPLEFPLYQGLVAGVAKVTGCSIESAGRAVSIGAFFAALPALAGLLASAGFPPRTRWIALAAVLVTPVYLFYARTVLIETTALSLALWFLHAYVRGLETRRWCWVLAAAGFGALAAMVKVTTVVPAATAGALWALVALGRAIRSRERAVIVCTGAALLLPALATVGAAWWWVDYADAVKAANPLAAHLRSAHLGAWTFGSLQQRLDPATWQALGRQITYTTGGLWALGLAVLCGVFAPRRHRLVALAAAAAFAAGPLCFFNLYFVHDYYFCANAAFLAVALGLLVAGLWENPRVPRVVAGLVALLIGGLQVLAFRNGLDFYFGHRPPGPPPIAAAVRAVVPAEAVVLMPNWSWNPQLLFYVERKALMLPDGFHNDVASLAAVTGRLAPGAVRGFVWRGRGPMPLEVYLFAFEDLGFSPEAVATDGENTLFVRTQDLAAARDRLAGLGLAGVELAAPAPTASPAVDGYLVFPAPFPDDNPVCQPAPADGRSLYGFMLAQDDGRDVIVAHAPSRLVVRPPAGARSVELGFHLAAACAQPETRSDGVVVAVYVAGGGRPRRMLYQRTLDPAADPGDRGLQTAAFALPAELDGTLVFEASTGVIANLSYDWFFWDRIVVR